MYTRISTGTSFGNAAEYNERGLSRAQQAQKAGKVELLATANLLSRDARGIAAEMQAVACRSRTEKAVWNISMSAPEGIRLTGEQWQRAAALNLTALGVDTTLHQYSIHRHGDTGHDHIHILLNAVPLGGGPALSRQFNARKARLAEPALTKALGLASRPKTGAGLAEDIAGRLATALSRRPTTSEELAADLAAAGLRVTYSSNVKGIYGLTLALSDQDHHPVKGSAITMADGQRAKWATLAALLEANRAHYEAEINRLKQEKAAEEQRRADYDAYITTLKEEINASIPRPIFDKLTTINRGLSDENQQLKERLKEATERQAARLASSSAIVAVKASKLPVTSRPAPAARVSGPAPKIVVQATPTPAKPIPANAPPSPVKSLLERFKDQFGFVPTKLDSIERLAAGAKLHFDKRALTIWPDGAGQLQSKPYQLALPNVAVDAPKPPVAIPAPNVAAETPKPPVASVDSRKPAWHEDLRNKIATTKNLMGLQYQGYQVELLNYGKDYRFRPHASRSSADWVKLSELSIALKSGQGLRPK